MASEDLSLVILNEDWAILFDDNQWIVSKRRKRREGTYWHPISYVGSQKAVLMRVARENGIQINAYAEAIIKAWPERFLEWLSSHQTKRDVA